jgi:hypothetical protein
MAGKILNFGFGVDGVNLVTDPLKLKVTEATQLQNAELVPNESTGGLGALTQRAGLEALNSSPLTGSVLGIFGWPLKTTVTKTLYAAKQTEDASTFVRSTNGSSWTSTSSPLAPVTDAYFADNSNVRTARRFSGFKGLLVYPGGSYTQDTDNPTVCTWDGTDAFTVTKIPVGSGDSSAAPFVIVDQLTVGDKLYLAVSDPGGGSPDFAGRVLQLNLTTGKIRQVASSFGNDSGQMSGGGPSCMCFYQDQLFVGLNGSATTNGIGKIVRCYPDVDETWTADVSNLVSHPVSMIGHAGGIFVGTKSSATTGAQVYLRSNSALTWGSEITSGGGADGNGHYGALAVYNNELYAVEYHDTTPIIHVKKRDSAGVWTTVRDVDSADSGVAGNLPGNAIVFNSKLYIAFRSLTAAGNDGFILECATTTWTKVLTDNLGGSMGILTERS